MLQMNVCFRSACWMQRFNFNEGVFMKRLVVGLIALLFSTSAFGQKIELTPRNSVSLRGAVSTESVSRAILNILKSDEKELYLFIDSPGGSIFAGMELVELLKSTDKKVVCVTNFAASMAFVILQACHERIVTNNGVLMQHVASYGLQGNEPNNYRMAQFLRRVVNKLDTEQAERLGLTRQQFQRLTRDDLWLIGDEALKLKAADRVGTVSCSKELINQTEKHQVRVLFFVIEVTMSKCPLINAPVKVGGDGVYMSAEEITEIHNHFDTQYQINKLRKK